MQDTDINDSLYDFKYINILFGVLIIYVMLNKYMTIIRQYL